MGDVVGRLFREFAVTLTIAILLSGVISLTLTPMMCAYLLKPLGKGETTSLLWERLLQWYDRALTKVLQHQGLMLGVALSTLIPTVLL